MEPRDIAEQVQATRLLASLNHPNIIALYESYVEKGHLFLVEELADGNLDAELAKRSSHKDSMREERVWSYFLQLALGVQHLHHHGILHRDLKPENVLIGEDGLLKIADLGIAIQLSPGSPGVQETAGTPHYLSPEEWRGELSSYPVDVWSLGCILHQLCSLEPLFLAMTLKEVKKKVLSGAVEPIPEQYSFELNQLVRKLLTADPAQRPSIDDVLALPVVKSRMNLLPAKCQHSIGAVGASPSRVPPLKVSPEALSKNWVQLNTVLPPPRYPDGWSGVSGSMHSVHADVRTHSTQSAPPTLEAQSAPPTLESPDTPHTPSAADAGAGLQHAQQAQHGEPQHKPAGLPHGYPSADSLQTRGSRGSGSPAAYQVQGQPSHYVSYLSSTLGGSSTSTGSGGARRDASQRLPQQQQLPVGTGPGLASPTNSGGVTRSSTTSNVSGSSGLSQTSSSSWSRGLGHRVGASAAQPHQDSLASGMQQLHISGHRTAGH
ncbi:hypothetical protein N2152v2_010140 [Parachlorella kessleri]